MGANEITEDKLNLFIDKQLDTDEMNEIHQILLDDKNLRERVCQLKAVRELVGYAYSEVPPSRYEKEKEKNSNSVYVKAIAASVTLVVGVLLGWVSHQYVPGSMNTVSAENVFQYVANQVTVNHRQRKIVLHIDSSDVQVVDAALKEVDYLLATYRNANAPLKLDVVTNKTGIDILRSKVSPYVDRIQELATNDNVSFYACSRAIAKASKKDGLEVMMMPGVITHRTVKDLISDRLQHGWVYIKA